MRVEGHENEIPGILRLLNITDIHDSTVSIDAIGAQRTIAEKIIKSDADYILGLKANQKTIFDLVELKYGGMAPKLLASQSGGLVETTDGDHGRIEVPCLETLFTSMVKHAKGSLRSP